jgi:hypothetical protein
MDTATETTSTARELGLGVWTAGRRVVAPAGTRIVHTPGRLGDVKAVITRDGAVLTDLTRDAVAIPAELVEAYLVRVLDRHHSALQRRAALRGLARERGVALA